MINLINKIINIIPFPAWIGVNNKIININDYFSIKLDVEISKLDILDNTIILVDNNEKIIISKEDNSKFSYKGKKYIHKTIKEIINNKVIEIGIFLDEDYLNNIDLVNETNILQIIIDNVPEIIFFKDNKGVYRGANKECVKFYNSNGVDEFIGKKDSDLPLDKDFIETCMEHDSIVFNTKKQLSIDEEYKNDEGKVDIFETIKTPILNKDNEVVGIVGVVRDVTNKKAEERKLRYLSYTDALTGLYNRAFFDEKIKKLMKNKKYPIGIIMGDINGLKLVNDTFGHIEGDKLITKTTDIIKKVCKNNELIFRWGGDEFIILIPKTSNESCKYLMDSINLALKNSVDAKIPLSMSMGYSLINNNKVSIDAALKEAESKLYRRKISTAKSIRSSVLSTLKERLQYENGETEEHIQYILDYCMKIAKKLNLGQDTINELRLLARLHDIGKVAIPEDILLKTSELTDEEYEIIKTHTEKGCRLVMTLPEVSHIAKGILTHHERWDGKGYPLGLIGNQIPLIARIISIVHYYDEMINTNSNVKTKVEAIEELKKCSGYQFDPELVEVFCNILNED